MKTPLLTSLYQCIAAGALLVYGSVVQASDMVARDYDIKDVSEVVVGGAGNLQIIQGDTESLHVEASKDVMEYVSVDQDGKKLRLGLKTKVGKTFNIFRWLNFSDEQVKFILCVKHLNYVEANGASHVQFSNWTGKGLEVHGTGASDINFVNVELEDLYMDLNGSSNGRGLQINTTKAKFDLSGAANMDVKEASKGKFLQVHAAGASNFRGKPLLVEKADVQATGASNIDVHVSEFLKAEATGASNIYYLGEPKVQRNATGASSVDAINN